LKTDPASQRLLLAALASRGDKSLLSLLWTRMQPLLLARQMGGLSAFPNPPAGNEVAGPILLGVVEATGAPYGLEPDDLLRNTAVFGSTGSGKTTLIKRLIHELTQESMKDVSFAIFSFNREYRDLVMLLGCQIVLLLRLLRYRFNPLEVPPGVVLREYLSGFATVFTQSSGLLIASRGLLLIMLAGLFDQYLPAVTGIYPALPDVLQFARSYDVPTMARAFECKGAIIDRLRSLLFATGDLFSCSTGFPMEEVWTRNVVWECDGLTPEHETFVILSLLHWLFSYHLANTPPEDGLRSVIVIDEANRMLDRSAQARVLEGVPLIATQIAQFRKTGCALIIAAQLPSRILDGAIENCVRKVCFQLGDGADIRTAASSLQLTPKQADILSRLEVGQAVVRDPRYPEPFVVRVLPWP